MIFLCDCPIKLKATSSYSRILFCGVLSALSFCTGGFGCFLFTTALEISANIPFAWNLTTLVWYSNSNCKTCGANKRIAYVHIQPYNLLHSSYTHLCMYLSGHVFIFFFQSAYFGPQKLWKWLVVVILQVVLKLLQVRHLQVLVDITSVLS